VKWHWSKDELETQWSLSVEELALLPGRVDSGRLGCALSLKFFQFQGVFPSHQKCIPQEILVYVAQAIHSVPEELEGYDWEGRTGQRHRKKILNFLALHRPSGEDLQRLRKWLTAEILPLDVPFGRLQELSVEWFAQQSLAPLDPTQLERLLRSTLHAFEAELFQLMIRLTSAETKASIDSLLAVEAPNVTDEDFAVENSSEAKETDLGLTHLKADSGRIGLDSVLQELAKLSRIRQMALPVEGISDLPAKWLQKYHRRTSTESSWELRRHPPEIRYTLVAIYCWQRQREITDTLIDLLIQVIHKIGSRAENKVEQELLNDLRRVRGKTNVLFKLAEAAVDEPNGVIKEVLYPVVGLETLKDLVKEFKASGATYHQVVHTVIRSSYGNHYRRMLPKILDALEFCSNNTAHRPVIDALGLLKAYRDSGKQYFSTNDVVPIEGIVKGKWLDIVVEKDKGDKECVNRINYEICVLQALRERLRSKEIWVVGANRFRNPDEDLPADFVANRAAYYEALKLPQNTETFIDELKKTMVDALSMVSNGMPKNPRVKILPRGKNRICITPLDAQPDPENLKRLKAEVFERWSSTSLLDILKETDLRVGFTELFQSSRQRETLDRDTLQRRLLLSLYALGTNAGLKRIAAAGHGASYQELRYVRQRFIQKSTLRAAIAQVANATFTVRLPEIWGEGTTTCAADSKKFGSWDQNLMTEWHIRYGGRGVMIYWHVERKSVCIYSQLKRCSSSEVSAMIEGVLRHDTDMDVQKSYTDSHGQSEVGFAFCSLLGFELLPRLKAVASQKLYLPEADVAGNYPNLTEVLTRPIKWDLIRQQYDEMVKYATALRLGTADAEAILRRFTRSNLQHPTYQALAELGKVLKTIFLCRYIDSEGLRREIHEGLNVVENWNSANGFIFYGKSGEVASNRLEDQELSVLSLHLLQLCLVYVNTLMIQHVLSDKSWRNKMTSADLRALSPLIYSHVNPYGRFDLDMSKRLPIEADFALAA
jgi:TnpA family transposase